MLQRFGVKTCFVVRCGLADWLGSMPLCNFSYVHVKHGAKGSIHEACPEEAVCWAVYLAIASENSNFIGVKKSLLTVLM